MLLFRNFFSLILYSVLTINAAIMTLQYFFGLSNIFGKAYEVLDDIKIAGLL